MRPLPRWVHVVAVVVHAVGMALGIWWATAEPAFGLLAGWSMAFGVGHMLQLRKPKHGVLIA